MISQLEGIKRSSQSVHLLEILGLFLVKNECKVDGLLKQDNYV